MRYLKSWVEITRPTEDVVHLEDRGIIGTLYYGVESKAIYLALTGERGVNSQWQKMVLTRKDAPQPTFVPAPEYDGDNDNWTRLTRRTNDPKLSWLQARLDESGVVNRRNGESIHAPILEVARGQLDKALFIVESVDDMNDDHPRFARGYAADVEP